MKFVISTEKKQDLGRSCSSKYGNTEEDQLRKTLQKKEWVCQVNKAKCIHEVKNKKINDYIVLGIWKECIEEGYQEGH